MGITLRHIFETKNKLPKPQHGASARLETDLNVFLGLHKTSKGMQGKPLLIPDFVNSLGHGEDKFKEHE